MHEGGGGKVAEQQKTFVLADVFLDRSQLNNKAEI